ncbi:hypothetical protein [Micromonospora chokoriensis]|uniref:Uncharacterized protein n=1 Tax=Micromonospora chokoriensis TaxID=356851 RepID=A0A1C4Z4A9_9ACTN|nr:hypothetical protein [Micromonospora chokoriensis]SCF27763.1 hypothetical protein GA0070612_5758 [Micromonospora chokoriensis]
MTDVLRVQDLRLVCGVLLDMVEERFGAEIDLSGVGVDLYWNVDLETAFAPLGPTSSFPGHRSVLGI